MSRLKSATFAMAAIAGLSSSAMTAHAESPEHFCRDYARTAVQQGEAARAAPRCRHFVFDNPARWTLDGAAHYHWCLGAYGSGGNVSERDARARDLAICLR